LKAIAAASRAATFALEHGSENNKIDIRTRKKRLAIALIGSK